MFVRKFTTIVTNNSVRIKVNMYCTTTTTKKIKTKHRPITYIFLILKFVFIRKNITNFYILSQVFLYIVCTGTDLIGMYVGMCFFFKNVTI